MKKALLSCPHCSKNQEIEIPTEKCIMAYTCEHCSTDVTIPIESKNCCVICEYSNDFCPVAHLKKQPEDTCTNCDGICENE